MKNQSMPNSCNNWAKRLAFAHLATVSLTEAEALSTHLASCEACAAVKREYDEIDRLIGNVTFPKSFPGLPPQLLQLLKEQVPQVSQLTFTSIGTPLSSNVFLATMSLSELADRCMHETEKYRQHKPYSDQYCLEIFHRAMVKHDPDTWELLQKRYSPIVRAWMRNHPQRDIAFRHQSEEDYVDETFVRVWQASLRNTLEFGSMAAALRYLKLCLQGAIIDTLRAYSRPKEVRLTDPGSDLYINEEPAPEVDYVSSDLWNIIRSLLSNERERRLAYLLYINGLKAREIVRYCPTEFSDIQEVYRLTRNIVERLTLNRDQIRSRLGPLNE